MPRSLRRRVLDATRWTALSVAVVFGAQFVQVIVLARVLEPRQVGQIAVVTLVMGLADLVVATGVTQAIVQRRGVTSRELSSLYWLNLAVALVAAGLVYGVSGVLASVFSDPGVVLLVQAASVLLVISSFGQVARALLEKRLQFKAIAVAEIVGAVALLAVSVVAALAGAGAMSAVLGLIAGAGVRNGAYRFAARRLFRLRLRFRLRDTRRFLEFGALQTADAVLNYVQNALSTAVTGGVVGTAAMGGYNLSYNLAVNTPAKLNPVVTRVMFPVFASLRSGDPRLRSGYELMNLAVGVVSIPALLTLAVLAEPVLDVLYGSRWVAFAPVLSVLCLVGALRALGNPVGSVVMATDSMRLGFAVNLGKAVITLPLILFGGLAGGALGAAWGVVASQVLGFLVSAAMLRRLIGLPLRGYARSSGLPFLLAAPAVVVLLLTRDSFAVLGLWPALLLHLLIAAALLVATFALWPDRSLGELRRSLEEHVRRPSGRDVHEIAVVLPAEERFDGSGGAVALWVHRIYRNSPRPFRIYSPSIGGSFAQDLGSRPLRAYDRLVRLDARLRRLLGRSGAGPGALLRSGRLYLWMIGRSVGRASVVHVHNRPTYATWLRESGYRGRIVLHMHNDLIDYVLPGALPLSRAVDAFIFCSDYLRSKAEAEFALPSDRAFTVHNGVDVELSQPVARPRPGRLLYAGRIVEEKGVAEAVEVCARLLERGREYSLSIIGGPASGSRSSDSPYLRSVSAAARSLNERFGEGTVTVVGPLDHERLLEEMTRAWAFLYPCNWEEPFGLVVVEAMSAGLPVVAYAKGGIPEIVEDGRTGRLLDRADGLDAFVDAIEGLEDQRVHDRIGSEARTAAAQRFSWDRLAEATFAVV